MSFVPDPLLILLGIVVGAYGTLIGAGGGFVLVPILLLRYPNESPQTITCITLAVVFFNALSGSYAYARMGRVDYRSAGLFCWSMVPAAILGALTTSYVPRHLFDLAFAVLLIAVCIYLLWRPGPPAAADRPEPAASQRRFLVEADGTCHLYAFRRGRALWLGGVISYVSSLLGVGGGIFHVPALVRLFNFPVHVATATSHFVLAIISLAATITHIASGQFQHGVRRTIALSIGVVIGAQFGAKLSSRVRGDWIIRALAVALGLVAIRVLIPRLDGLLPASMIRR